MIAAANEEYVGAMWEGTKALELMLASRALRLGESSHPDSSEAISLDSGYAFPGIFPNLGAAAESALTTYRSESLQYGRPLGLQPLREWIAHFLKEDGVSLNPDEIIVVNGAKNGLDLLCRLFTEEGDAVAVTAPTYFTAIPILRSFGLEFVEVLQDEHGMDVASLSQMILERNRQGKRPPKFIYDVPDFHNPTGITMSRARREELLALATTFEIPIIEDSPYRKLRYEGESLPSLKALDRDGIVFALGTFSKLLAPGLRVGWVGGTRGMVERIARLKSDGGTSPLTQRIVLEFCKDGGMEAHLKHAREAYHQHRDLMLEALRAQLPETSVTVPHGGYYLWVKFPAGIDTDRLAHRALEKGVSVIAGSAFFAGDAATRDPERAPKRFVRLAYSRATPQEIQEGVQRLTAAYHSMR
jgi:2-aminoadipate transaminase